MSTRLLLFFCLIGPVVAKEPPDVDCLVIHLKYVNCSWNKQRTPEVNYTFYSWFHNEEKKICSNYLLENGINIGCNRPYGNISKRFFTFYTTLVHGNKSFPMEHDLKTKVLLHPPTNLSVLNGSDFNLWFYWNQTAANCVGSEVRFRTNNNKWESSKVNTGTQSFCINLPSSSSRYEVQVRSRMAKTCGESLFWSNWSEPVVWGSNNSTDTNPMNVSMSVWTPLLYVVGAITLLLLVIMLLHHERLRIILIPVVPKPSLVHHDIEDWLQFSKGLNENFKANFIERACPVREYCQISQSDSESSGDSTFSVSITQSDCSDQSEDLSTPCSSSSSTVTVSSDEQQISV
ncbi:cytokine receptor common subunit gamma-like [Mastacembelus armatus]|uniref:Cytokine receptor common subunit gamma-like n=1 Tax=Mastacembelus armatus TaxID=205130 RepID=A0A3Q3MVB7_9TELE|nr:cytokine receptor common subunit gamma-like [Mastacembelus armatus]